MAALCAPDPEGGGGLLLNDDGEAAKRTYPWGKTTRHPSVDPGLTVMIITHLITSDDVCAERLVWNRSTNHQPWT